MVVYGGQKLTVESGDVRSINQKPFHSKTTRLIKCQRNVTSSARLGDNHLSACPLHKRQLHSGVEQQEKAGMDFNYGVRLANRIPGASRT